MAYSFLNAPDYVQPTDLMNYYGSRADPMQSYGNYNSGGGYAAPAQSAGPSVISTPYSQRPSGFQSFLSNMNQYRANPRQKVLGGLAAQAGKGGFMGGLGSVAKFFL